MLSVTGLNHFYYVVTLPICVTSTTVCCLSSVNGFTENRVMGMSSLSCQETEDLSNRPDGYKTMGVAGEAMHIVSDGYKAYVLIGDELKSAQFKDTVYQVCISHAKIFAYLDDVELPIDNNLAERTSRKLTTQRSNSLRYGSDVGAEMAAIYHSVIGTVKLHSSSVWNFIGTFIKSIFNITLATGQC